MHVIFGKRRNRTCRCFAFRGVPEPAIVSLWTLELKHHDAKIRADVPLLT
jgi:hypothetical protein